MRALGGRSQAPQRAPAAQSGLRLGRAERRASTAPVAALLGGMAALGTQRSALPARRCAPLLRPGAVRRAQTVQVQAFIKNLFKNDPAENTRKKYQARVDQINALEPQMQALSDEQLRGKTAEFKARVAKGESLEALLPEAFAVGGERRIPASACRPSRPGGLVPRALASACAGAL